MDGLREALPDSSDYLLGPAAVVRLASSPAAVLDGLRCDRTWHAAEELVRMRAEIAEAAKVVSELLHAAIGAVADGESKDRLVAVRRAVRRTRRVNPARLADVPAELLAPMQDWTQRLADRDRLLAVLPELLEQDLTANYESLRAAARLHAFQLGLVHANPDAFLALRKWLDTGRPPRRQRVLRLAKYLARSAAKTSPYSTFTGSGLAAWDTARDGVELSPRLAEGRLDAATATATEVSVGSVHRIARAVLERPEFAGGCQVRTNPSATATDGALLFLGRRPVEHVHTLALTPMLRHAMELTVGEVTLDELRDKLAARAADARQAAVFLQRLLSLGLLELVPPLADQSPDPIADLRAWFQRHWQPGVERLDATLRAVHEALSCYSTITAPDARIAVRDAVVRGLDTALREVGDHSHADNPKLAAEFARYSFYENAVFPGTAAVLDRRVWRPLLDDLDAVRTLLGLIGPDLPFKLTLSELFRQRYPEGAEIPLLMFYRDVLIEQSAAALDPAGGVRPVHRPFADADSAVETVRELHRLRAAAKRLLGSRKPDPDGVVRVDPEEIRSLAKEWPEWVRTPTSVAVYCQLAETTRDPELVVNSIGCGFGRGRNRVRQVLDMLDLRGDAPAEPGLAVGCAGVLFAEFEAVARSAVNVRKPSVRLVVDYPGVRSAREREDLLPVNDLYVKCGEDGLLALRSRRLEKQICPVHPGLGAGRLLPPAARFMVEAFGESNIWLAADTDLRMTSAPRANKDVLHLPRLMVGGVVLRRAMWLTRADRLPRRSDAAGDADWMLRIAGWLAEHDMPARCFVTILDPAALGQGGTGRGYGNDVKPNYLDFASMLLLLGLEPRLAEPNAFVHISEMMPDPGHIRGERAAEFIVELSEPGVTYA